ncbi:MAG: 1-deoxy-D-xylulose-5-phosphate reductoisomerase, partial [Xanthomonadales bacterium]|nr:1-deoxy-D-xylulose-5-phosphate reductoisomerase [Xanthomonadales bacterium]
RILLANKEALVVAGALFTREAQAAGAVVVPVDSEHNALFQALPPDAAGNLDAAGVEKLVLTASGGPFLHHSREQLAAVTPEQACAHPNWDMGRKISVDSATLMNKGLEVIEAHWLFGARQDQVDVVVHPQSIVHGLVMMRDGSVLAQLGAPDMRTPIAHALAWPERLESGVERLNLVDAGPLEFRAPDLERFPCLRLAFDALRAGGNAPLVLNAANEIAVEAFLQGQLPFLGIAAAVADVLDRCAGPGAEDLDGLLAQDADARTCADEVVRQLMAKHG